MALLDEALARLKETEGGWSDDPADPGGATNWGVTLRQLVGLGTDLGDLDRDGDVDADDLRKLSWEQACELVYVPLFWRPYRWERLPDAIALKCFDLAVNMGPSQTIRLLQRALRSCLERVTEDGMLGPETCRAANRIAVPGALMAALRSEAAGFYRCLVERNAGAGKFLAGWLNRAYR